MDPQLSTLNLQRSGRPGVIARYARYLPVSDATPVVTLNEGDTPLVRADNLVAAIGWEFELWLKYEGLNPTCSFKDRGMTVAVSKAKERGAQVVICASTGNTSASAAAYAARAQMKCVVLLPHGNITLGKLAQALMYGATTIAVEGNFDDALRIVRELGKTGKVEVVNSVNPDRIDGQKTAAFEICDQLGRAPDFHFLPVGNAGNITAYWKGFKEYFAAGQSKGLPRLFGWQAAGAAPIVDGHPVEKPLTVASAIRIGNPASWEGALNAIRESNGHIDKVRRGDSGGLQNDRADGRHLCGTGILRATGWLNQVRHSQDHSRGKRHHRHDDRSRAERPGHRDTKRRDRAGDRRAE